MQGLAFKAEDSKQENYHHLLSEFFQNVKVIFQFPFSFYRRVFLWFRKQ